MSMRWDSSAFIHDEEEVDTWGRKSARLLRFFRFGGHFSFLVSLLVIPGKGRGVFGWLFVLGFPCYEFRWMAGSRFMGRPCTIRILMLTCSLKGSLFLNSVLLIDSVFRVVSAVCRSSGLYHTLVDMCRTNLLGCESQVDYKSWT
jgi:hypothetical protein